MIDKWLNKVDQLNTKNLILYIVAASVLLAAWMQYIQRGWINPDSVLYLEQARLFSQGEGQAAFQVFRWPLYGFCIGLTAQLTSLSIHTSAQLLNMIFFGIATASFLNLIKLAGGSARTILLGTLLLFGSQYIVGDALEMLMRDQGFWACYLSAILFFIRYCQNQQPWDAIAWQLCIIFATLFRIEGFFYLLLLPLLYFLQCSTPLKARLYQALNTYSLSIVISIVITAILVFRPELTMSALGRLDEIFTIDLLQKLTAKLIAQSTVMADQVLGKYLDEFAFEGLLLTFVYVTVAKVVSTTGLMTTALSAFGIKQAYQRTYTTPRHILFIVASIALFAALIIIIKVFVLSGRYVVALTWVLLIFASFYLAKLSESDKKNTRILFVIICIALCLGLIKNTLPKRDGYNYRQDAVAWVKSNSKNSQAIFYDDVRMVYFANAPFTIKWDNNWQVTQSAIENGTIKDFEFLLINHSRKYPDRLQLIKEKLPGYIEVKRFNNPKAKKFVVVYARAK